MGDGAQCAMMVSVPLTLQLLADNLVMQLTVDMEMFEPLGKDLNPLSVIISLMGLCAFITHAVIVKEMGQFCWIMSTVILQVIDYHSAVIVDGV